MSRDTTDLQEKLLTALRKGQGKKALELIEQIERVEGHAPRWPHRRGDLLRRLDRPKEAIASYEKAVDLYAKDGFVARAAALAKVVLEIDPGRTDVLARVEPDEARKLYRQQRSSLASAAEDRSQGAARLARTVSPLERAADASDDEVRFTDAADEPVIELDVDELELVSGAPAGEAEDDVETLRSAAELARFASTPLFAEIPKDALSQLLLDSDLRELEAGQAVVRTGEPSDALFVITTGFVEVRVPGRGSPVGLSEGDVVGESCLLDGADRRADVVARGPVKVLRIPKPALDRLVSRYPRVEDLLLEMLTRRLVLNLVRTSPLFQAFDDATKLELARLFEVRRADAGTVLIEAGKRSDGLYILLVGSTEVCPPGSAPQPIPRGRPFGERSLLSREAATAGVRVTSEAVLLRLPASRFAELAALYPTVLEHLAELAAAGESELQAAHLD